MGPRRIASFRYVAIPVDVHPHLLVRPQSSDIDEGYHRGVRLKLSKCNDATHPVLSRLSDYGRTGRGDGFGLRTMILLIITRILEANYHSLCILDYSVRLAQEVLVVLVGLCRGCLVARSQVQVHRSRVRRLDCTRHCRDQVDTATPRRPFEHSQGSRRGTGRVNTDHW